MAKLELKEWGETPLLKESPTKRVWMQTGGPRGHSAACHRVHLDHVYGAVYTVYTRQGLAMTTSSTLPLCPWWGRVKGTPGWPSF